VEHGLDRAAVARHVDPAGVRPERPGLQDRHGADVHRGVVLLGHREGDVLRREALTGMAGHGIPRAQPLVDPPFDRMAPAAREWRIRGIRRLEVAEAKRKVAILGGGLASLAAAYELTSRSDCEVTIYQTGWRLGGKCATGRNRKVGERVEDHGIHLFFGCYENAFDLMRRAFDELGRPSGGLPGLDLAFRGLSHINLQEQVPPGSDHWRDWKLWIPPLPGKPGERACEAREGAGKDGAVAGLEELVDRLLDWLEGHVAGHSGRQLRRALGRRFLRPLRQRMDALRKGEPPSVRRPSRGILHRILGWMEGWITRNDTLRHFWILFELGYSVASGLLEEWARGNTDFSKLDRYELREFLDLHGPLGRLTRVTRESAPLRMVYEVLLSFHEGDPTRPDIAAGAALRMILRIFLDRQGEVAYQMTLGTGETLITPLYEVLAKRGVRFRFFHRVKDLELDRDGKQLKRIHLGIQAKPKHGKEYVPVFALEARHGLLCWPNTPDYDLLEEGAELQKGHELPSGGYDLESPWTAWRDVDEACLEQGSDFDVAILGISLGGLEEISQGLKRHASWRQMLEGLGTVATQSFQLWADKETRELGWDNDEGRHPALVGAYSDPFASWVEMTDVLAWEVWDGATRPKSLHYFSGALPDVADAPHLGPNPDWLRLRRGDVGDDSLEWIARWIGHLWPDAVDWAGFRWGWLNGVGSGDERFQSQFWRANVNPSDRYVPNFHGTTGYRLAADEAPVDHLVLSGDWIRTRIDIGCAEAAVVSGLHAARAVLGQAFPIYGE
jgi:uncharacterized protein with NAD-binding domain and iron-sulfur cluster